MHLMYFTEQPMSTYPPAEGDRYGYTALLFPNKFFDPISGSRLYNERLEEYQYVDECGWDGIMLNEHHNAPFCMQAKTNIFATAIAATTKRVKIVLLGNPLPVADNPVRLAEELAMIDLLSKGRLVPGIVRGGGVEAFASNTNPAFNRERFEEAHDLIIKTWTQPGPWRWEGNHYQFRVVNPWVIPMQKPHPRIWVPGVSSRETIVWCAQHGYPYIALNLPIAAGKEVWRLYDETAEQSGYKGGPEYRGYLLRVRVDETEEKAMRNVREFMWMQGEFTGLTHPVWAAPSGYLGEWARRPMAELRAGYRQKAKHERVTLEDQLRNLTLIAGNPKQVIEKLRIYLEETRPSIVALWGNDGRISHEDSLSYIRLMGQEVLPALREIGKELGLNSPFELNTPVSRAYADVKPETPTQEARWAS
ncbi:MAG TPA: LLM class flavin-dependent oxidoreductase [Candidatus Binataceae bacterium]|nr:LLM class flavin-dependent oxidoreductase [Candidatus Binataceae bacterium]